LILFAACSPMSASTAPPSGDAVDAPVAMAVDVSADLAPIATSKGVPALAAVAADDTAILGAGVTGVRKLGDPTTATSGDKWHLGSDTKAMTATLIATAVEAGTLGWDTTLQQAFPELTIDAGYRDVTIAMLLAHVGGAPANLPNDVLQIMTGSGTSRALRYSAVKALLSRTPGAVRGTFTYSNAGYMIAGAALERATNTGWEQLMADRLFRPLGMMSCGFGPAASTGQVDQPWGHQLVNGQLTPINADNPAALGPAGTAHCALADWLAFLREHLRGANGDSTELGLSPATWSKLHTPYPGSDYALGWIVVSRPWAGGIALTHVGSNTLNVADVWIAPATHRIFISAGNRGDDPAIAAADAAIAALVARFPMQ